jgi:hypothetical protein
LRAASSSANKRVKGKGPLGSHTLELVAGNQTLADAHKIGQRWSMSSRSPEWPHKISEHRFRLRKAEVITTMTQLAENRKAGIMPTVPRRVVSPVW